MTEDFDAVRWAERVIGDQMMRTEEGRSQLERAFVKAAVDDIVLRFGAYERLLAVILERAADEPWRANLKEVCTEMAKLVREFIRLREERQT